MTLTSAFVQFCEELTDVFPQRRTVRRATNLMLSGLLCVGRKWVTRLLSVQGREQEDWSADYKLFSRSKWKAWKLYQPVVRESLKYFGDGPIVLAGDETRTPRGGRRVKRSRWTRDPMSPPFHVNFIKGIRWVQFSALLPLHAIAEVSARGIPVSFEPVDQPAKPRRNAPAEQWAEYRRAKKQNNMCVQTLDQLRTLRFMYDQAGASHQLIVAGLDGGFCNRTIFQSELDRIALLARARKDARLCRPANDPQRPRKVYSDETFTPEQIRKDDSIAWRRTTVWFGGANRTVKYKELTDIRWQRGAKRKALRLFVVAPTPYRLSPGMPRYYRQPSYLLVTDHTLSAETLLQCYFDRWQIEVNNREEKQHFGVADAQVCNDDSVDRLPAFMVAGYSFLLLAALKAFGPVRTQDYLQPPKWQRGQRQRPSCLDLLAKLREEAQTDPQTWENLDFQPDLRRILLRAA